VTDWAAAHRPSGALDKWQLSLRIEKAFGPKMDHLLRMQLEYDVAQARKREAGMKVRKVQRAA
jgi:plasmid maintenance system antidote protein VapI